MDFGVLGLEGLVAPETAAAPSQPPPTASASSSFAHTKQKVLGSGFAKQQRSGSGEDDWRSSKLPKTMLLHQATTPHLLRSNTNSADTSGQQEYMLSFSSAQSEVPYLTRDCGMLLQRSSNNAPTPYHQPAAAATAASAYARNAGYVSGSLNATMHGHFAGGRGPFSPSQWIELEHQALIYKYITANVPVPSNLLMSLKKSLYSFTLTGSSAGSLSSNSFGWGSFHLGFSGSTDPEPGRCRRTDGKKWRCSRDAVADQKYCERHINRGRHRSRKPVEGQTGHAATGPTANSKLAVVPQMTSSMPSTSAIVTSSSAPNSLAMPQHQLKNLQPVAANRPNPSADSPINRVQDPRGLSTLSSAINMKSNDTGFSMQKQDILLEELSEFEFGLVSSDSLLNPSQRSSYMNSKNYVSYLDFGDQEAQEQHPFHQFMDDWPKDQSNHSGITWPEELKSDWTQLSMSIPMPSSEFSSSTSSPTQKKLALSPLKLSREFDPTIQMGLRVNSDIGELSKKRNNMVAPIPWGSSMGGPLGEVLTSTTNSLATIKNSSAALNLVSEGWDGSPQLDSSPTGVLQKSAFGSLSNSSSGSSSIVENKKGNDGASLCEDVLGSTLASSSIPSL